MIRPVTCICLVLAAGSGLYLYQVKQRAFALDADLRSTYHSIDMARDRTRMLRADWALMNDPERLQALADQYLSLKPMAPSQLKTLDQLASALPAPGTTRDGKPIVPVPALPGPSLGVPMVSATPPKLPGVADTGPRLALAPPVQVTTPLQAAPPDQTALQAPSAQPAPDVSLDADADALPEPPVAQPPAPPLAASAPDTQVAVNAPLAPPRPLAPPAVAKRPAHVRAAAHKPEPPTDQIASGDATTSADGLAPAIARPRHHHQAAPSFVRAPGQLYAANEPPARPPAPLRTAMPMRITPPAATVMYRAPVSGSSLGMAAADLPPPRPLYSSQ
jgi:hypothetical protein